ncbi:hypothetical protein CMV_025691 [Castanea mollissima]|uniref:Uncharacterized protein n=1 Tax=Castanea mollissima TaxID=60419 RepID=A0A8J4QCA0_9ROSI|nr:hypothetical protein CMV_025691 [Castanea mollissima]
MAHVKWSSSLDSIEVPVPIEMSVTANPYVYEFVYMVGCKHCKIDNKIVQIHEYFEDEFDEDEIDEEETDKDEVDEEESDEDESEEFCYMESVKYRRLMNGELVLLNGSTHCSRAAFVVYETDYL